MFLNARELSIMNIAIDLILSAVFALFVVFGALKGFAKIIYSAASYFFAFVVSRAACTFLASFVYAHFIRDICLSTLSSAGVTISSTVGEIVSALPSWLSYSVGAIGLGNVYDLTSSVAGDIEADFLSPLITTALKSLIFIVLFILITIILKLISGISGGLGLLKPVKKADRALGALFGALEGALLCFAVCIVLRFICSFVAVEGIRTAVDESYICRFNQILSRAVGLTV